MNKNLEKFVSKQNKKIIYSPWSKCSFKRKYYKFAAMFWKGDKDYLKLSKRVEKI